jgi:hypothetical protein
LLPGGDALATCGPRVLSTREVPGTLDAGWPRRNDRPRRFGAAAVAYFRSLSTFTPHRPAPSNSRAQPPSCETMRPSYHGAEHGLISGALVQHPCASLVPRAGECGSTRCGETDEGPVAQRSAQTLAPHPRQPLAPCLRGDRLPCAEEDWGGADFFWRSLLLQQDLRDKRLRAYPGRALRQSGARDWRRASKPPRARPAR